MQPEFRVIEFMCMSGVSNSPEKSKKGGHSQRTPYAGADTLFVYTHIPSTKKEALFFSLLIIAKCSHVNVSDRIKHYVYLIHMHCLNRAPVNSNRIFAHLETIADG